LYTVGRAISCASRWYSAVPAARSFSGWIAFDPGDFTMPPADSRPQPVLFLLLIALLAGLAFSHSPGTTDVGIWQRWLNNAMVHGLVRGYAANQADYPPLAHTILFAAGQVFQPLQVSTFLSIKYSILFFLLLTSFLFWLWTRDIQLSLLLYFALLLNSVGLGYIDIYFAPGLVWSLWLLKERRWAWFSLVFALTCLTKWQPLIIAPFMVVYLLGVEDIRQWRQLDGKKILLQLILPAAGVTALAALVFGPQPLWLAFRASLGHPYLSGNALNLNWVITHFLHVLAPNQYGALQNGLSGYIMTDSLSLTILPRLLFGISYLLALGLFFRREKTFANLLIFSTLGFLCYYTLNTGVHENHLFLVGVLAVAIFWLRKDWRATALMLLLMNDLNLFLFYGLDGELHFPRLFAGVDIALPLAALNVVFFIYLYYTVMFSAPRPTLKA
jgi:hypothetical protein